MGIEPINCEITWHQFGRTGEVEPPQNIRLLLAYKINVYGQDEWTFRTGVYEKIRQNNTWEGKSRIYGTSTWVERWSIGSQKGVRCPDYWAEITPPYEIEEPEDRDPLDDELYGLDPGNYDDWAYHKG